MTGAAQQDAPMRLAWVACIAMTLGCGPKVDLEDTGESSGNTDSATV